VHNLKVVVVGPVRQILVLLAGRSCWADAGTAVLVGHRAAAYLPFMRTWLQTATAMLAFAANSILARFALSEGDIDPVAFAGIRLVSGAMVLALIAGLRSGAIFRPHLTR